MNNSTNPNQSEWKFSSITRMNWWRNEVRRLLNDNTTYPEGWSLSHVDPGKALSALPCLSIMPGWKWITFQFMSSGNGNSITFAVPEKVMDRAGNWLNQLRDSPHHPLVYARNGSLLPEAKRHFMDAVTGDGSTDSFAQASLLLREIGAIGGYWHGAGWSTCEIFQSQWLEPEDSDWDLVEGCRLPSDSTPLVFIEENVAHCRFYVKTDMGGRCISLDEDIFFGSSMRPESVGRVIATSKRGGWIP